MSGAAEGENQGRTNRQKAKKMKPVPVDKLAIIYRYLLTVTVGLSAEQVKSVHQNPL